MRKPTLADDFEPAQLYSREQIERAANAAFDRLSLFIKFHDSDRRLVTEAVTAFLDDPNSPYPWSSHTDDEEE